MHIAAQPTSPHDQDVTIKAKIITVHPETPDPEKILIGANTIRAGGVVVFPTQCLYGLGANALDEVAIDRIFTIKNRPQQKPLLILIPDINYLGQLTDHISAAAKKLMAVFWPGSITLLFSAMPHLPENLTAGTGKIGIRLPLHPAAQLLVREAVCPITGTSANLSDQPGCMQLADISEHITHQVDVIIDAGTLKGGVGSTIIDVTVTPPVIVRQGVIPSQKIKEALR